MVDGFALNWLQTETFKGFGKTLCESFGPRQVYLNNHWYQAFQQAMKLLSSKFTKHFKASFSIIKVPLAELRAPYPY